MNTFEYNRINLNAAIAVFISIHNFMCCQYVSIVRLDTVNTSVLDIPVFIQT